MVRIALCLILMSVAAVAQTAPPPLPPLDPTLQLQVCQAQRARFLSDSEQASTYAQQFFNEIADLKKKSAEAEKLSENEIADLKKRLAEAEARQETKP